MLIRITASDRITTEQLAQLVKDSGIAEGAADEAEVKSRVRATLEELVVEYANQDHGVEIRQRAGGSRMSTKPEQHEMVRCFARSLKPPIRLSLPALETLAVIAYKQPATVPEINDIRGVDSGGVIGTLLERKLITTAGRKQVIGRPILYKTTKEFLMRFGLKDVHELPRMEEFEKLLAESFQSDLIPGEAAPVETSNASDAASITPIAEESSAEDAGDDSRTDEPAENSAENSENTADVTDADLSTEEKRNVS